VPGILLRASTGMNMSFGVKKNNNTQAKQLGKQSNRYMSLKLTHITLFGNVR
jgi:hypothetical protein